MSNSIKIQNQNSKRVISSQTIFEEQPPQQQQLSSSVDSGFQDSLSMENDDENANSVANVNVSQTKPRNKIIRGLSSSGKRVSERINPFSRSTDNLASTSGSSKTASPRLRPKARLQRQKITSASLTSLDHTINEEEVVSPEKVYPPRPLIREQPPSPLKKITKPLFGVVKNHVASKFQRRKLLSQSSEASMTSTSISISIENPGGGSFGSFASLPPTFVPSPSPLTVANDGSKSPFSFNTSLSIPGGNNQASPGGGVSPTPGATGTSGGGGFLSPFSSLSFEPTSMPTSPARGLRPPVMTSRSLSLGRAKSDRDVSTLASNRSLGGTSSPHSDQEVTHDSPKLCMTEEGDWQCRVWLKRPGLGNNESPTTTFPGSPMESGEPVPTTSSCSGGEQKPRDQTGSAGGTEFTLQLFHRCKTCQQNYRADISKHFRRSKERKNTGKKNKNSAAIIWYRYFARYCVSKGQNNLDRKLGFQNDILQVQPSVSFWRFVSGSSPRSGERAYCFPLCLRLRLLCSLAQKRRSRLPFAFASLCSPGFCLHSFV